MAPTQDLVTLAPPALGALDAVPAVVVALVLAAFALALVLVAVRRRDVE